MNAHYNMCKCSPTTVVENMEVSWYFEFDDRSYIYALNRIINQKSDDEKTSNRKPGNIRKCSIQC